ncbi:MAG: zinc ribbon domain-containing protein [Clostridiales Family XIII bacterium]|jgi:RNA polymerase subunit RPABC4/transcription elongation factor Spt4|nr:zinc ribbon domain-containing protein [Clostridiales Family XIII bacterium]
MATYKQPCIHCGALVERDARFCPSCGSGSPFGYLCPACLRSVQKGSEAVCAGCGRPLYTTCPICGGRTFVAQERCEACGAYLMIRCPNKRCGVAQFFENGKCTACGKTIKPKDRVLQAQAAGPQRR